MSDPTLPHPTPRDDSYPGLLDKLATLIPAIRTLRYLSFDESLLCGGSCTEGVFLNSLQRYPLSLPLSISIHVWTLTSGHRVQLPYIDDLNSVSIYADGVNRVNCRIKEELEAAGISD